jgi:AraC-like DNA-binding protein
MPREGGNIVTASPRTVESTAAKLLASSRAELAQLGRILQQSRCVAIIRGSDGTVLPVVATDITRNNSSTERTPTLSSPIYDSDGSPFAFLQLESDDVGYSSLTDTLLRAIVDSSARAISERWFRISYLRHWIVAAHSVNDPDKYILLAVDRDHHLVGADHACRGMLEQKGLNSTRPLPLSAFFHSAPSVFNGGRHCERSLRLMGADDGAPWTVLITPPDLGDTGLAYGNRVLLHSRPRLDTMTSLGEGGSDTREIGGLSPSVCRRIDEFIDARLEARIGVAKLASSFGISASHFFRKFRHSFGMTPHAYIMRRRLCLAQELLAKTDIAMVDIALKAGFADQSHFSRNFHRFTGLPPRVFRMQHS